MVESRRFSASAALVGAIVGLTITPFMAAVWAYEPGVVWSDLSPLVKVVGPTLESWGALSFGTARVIGDDGNVLSESTAYHVYGKAFFLVYVLMMPIVRYVHSMHLTRSASTWESRIWRVLWVALVLACVGDAASYWGVSIPRIGDGLWGFGFLIEILAGIVLLMAMTAYGAVSMRHHVIPRWASLLLIGVVPIGGFTLITITTYVPNAVIVPLSLIWASIGVWVLFGAAHAVGPQVPPPAA